MRSAMCISVFNVNFELHAFCMLERFDCIKTPKYEIAVSFEIFDLIDMLGATDLRQGHGA